MFSPTRSRTKHEDCCLFGGQIRGLSVGHVGEGGAQHSPLWLLVPKCPMSWAVSYRENIVVTWNVAVAGQVVWTLDEASAADTRLLDHADGGLNFVDVFVCRGQGWWFGIG